MRLFAALLTFIACFKAMMRIGRGLHYVPDERVIIIMGEILPMAACLLLCVAISLREHPVRTNVLLVMLMIACVVGVGAMIYQNRYLYLNYQDWNDQGPYSEDYLPSLMWQYYTELRAYEIRLLKREVQLLRDLLYVLSHTAQSLVIPLSVSACLTGDAFVQAYGKEKGMGSFARRCIEYALGCVVLGILLNETNNHQVASQVIPMGLTAELILHSALGVATILTCRRYRREKE